GIEGNEVDGFLKRFLKFGIERPQREQGSELSPSGIHQKIQVTRFGGIASGIGTEEVNRRKTVFFCNRSDDTPDLLDGINHITSLLFLYYTQLLGPLQLLFLTRWRRAAPSRGCRPHPARRRHPGIRRPPA